MEPKSRSTKKSWKKGEIQTIFWAVVVAQLTEQSLPISEIHSSNPDIGEILQCACLLIAVEKTKIKKKAREWPIKKILPKHFFWAKKLYRKWPKIEQII